MKMLFSTYLLPLAFALVTAGISFGPPSRNPSFPVPNPKHPAFAPPPPNQAGAEELPTLTKDHPIHPLTRRQDIVQPTPFSHFPGGPPGGHVFVEKHDPVSVTDSVIPPHGQPTIISASDVQQPTWAPSSDGEAYTGHPSPLPTSGLSISSLSISNLPTSIVIDTSTPGYSHEPSTHPASSTIVSTVAIPSTSITAAPNPGGPINTSVSVPPTYLNSTVTTEPITGITTSTKVTTPPTSSPTGSGTSASGSRSASPSPSPSPTSSLGTVLVWDAGLFVAGFVGVFAFGML